MNRFPALSSMILLALAVLILLPSGLAAQDEEAPPVAAPEGGGPPPKIDEQKTPWLKGVTIPTTPPHPSPVLKAEILMGDGSPVPASLTEDIPVLMMVSTDIYAEKPPDSWKGEALPNAVWAGQASVRWFFDDIGKNESTMASCSEPLAGNQMRVTPLNPSHNGGVTVTLARPMKYEEKPGKFRTVFANASRGLNIRVLDITPPTCGLEISCGKSQGTFWVVENPPHKYPLPKMADVLLKGPLFDPNGQDEQVIVSGVELGANMVLTSDQGQLRLPKDGVVKIQLVLQDNEKVDEKSISFGFCEIVGGKPAPVGEKNPVSVDLSKLKLPAKAYIYIDAKDISGNHQVLSIPVSVK